MPLPRPYWHQLPPTCDGKTHTAICTCGSHAAACTGTSHPSTCSSTSTSMTRTSKSYSSRDNEPSHYSRCSNNEYRCYSNSLRTGTSCLNDQEAEKDKDPLKPDSLGESSSDGDPGESPSKADKGKGPFKADPGGGPSWAASMQEEDSNIEIRIKSFSMKDLGNMRKDFSHHDGETHLLVALMLGQ